MPYLALGLLALIWGASFLFIKVAVQDMSPATLVLIRVVSATVTLSLVFLLRRQSPFSAGTRRRLPAFVVMAIFSSVLPWLGFAFGEQYITSALASIINATTPLWTTIFAYWVTRGEPLSPLNYVGVAVGFVGTGIALGPDLLGERLHATALGIVVVLGAAASYSVAALYQRRSLRGVSPLQASLGQMMGATLIMLPIAAPTIGETHLHAASLASVLALGIGGSGIAYLLFYYIINSLGAVRVTTVTFLLPITAVIWGISILHERVTMVTLAGMAIILAGVYFTSRHAYLGPHPVRRTAAEGRPGPR